MADNGAYVISWGNTRPGMAISKAMEVLATSLAYYDGLQKDGRITGYRVFGSTQGMGGFLLLEGDRHELAKISVEEDSLKLLAKAGAVVDGLTTAMYAGGSGDDATEFYLKGLASLQESGLGG